MSQRTAAQKVGIAQARSGTVSEAEWASIVEALGLSAREAELVRQAMHDDSVGGMARALGLSPNTIHTYRDRLFRKLRVTNFCQVMVTVFRCYVATEASKRQRLCASTGTPEGSSLRSSDSAGKESPAGATPAQAD